MMASVRSMLTAPFRAGTSSSDLDMSTRDGSISATVLGACIQTFAAISLFLMYIANMSSQTEIPITVWEFISITQCVGILSIVILACYVYHKRGTWEINSRHRLGGRKFVFLWIFGLAAILQFSFIASINIYCLQSANNPLLLTSKHVYQVSLAKNFNSIIFYALQIGFISYFYRVKFEASKIVNYCMMLIMTATIVEYVNSVLGSGLLGGFTNNTIVAGNHTDNCFMESPIRQFALKIYDYSVPAKTEFALLSSACLLQMWSSLSAKRSVYDVMNQDRESQSLLRSEKINYRSVNNTPWQTAGLQTHVSKPISMYVTMVIGALFSLPVLIVVCIALYVSSSSREYLSDWEAICIYKQIFLFTVLMMTFYQMSVIRDTDFIAEAFDSDEVILTFCACGAIAIYCFDTFASFMSDSFPVKTVRFLMANSILGFINIFLQTVLIIQSNKIQLTFRRPESRIRLENLFLLLHILNVAFWLEMTLTSNKLRMLTPIQQEYYGKENWEVVTHILVPLFMYYRFQSSLDLHNLFCKYRL